MSNSRLRSAAPGPLQRGLAPPPPAPAPQGHLRFWTWLRIPLGDSSTAILPPPCPCGGQGAPYSQLPARPVSLLSDLLPIAAVANQVFPLPAPFCHAACREL